MQYVPLNVSTKDLINSKSVRAMKEGTILLNYSRGFVVNEENLIGALKSGKVSKYVTDFPNNRLLGVENVICTPHIGASTEEAEDNCAVMAAEQLMDYIENGNITNSVNYPAASLGALNKDTFARICIINKNVPSILGKITGTLSDMNINIRDMINKSRGDYAYTLVDIDSEIDENVLRKKLAMDGIISIRMIRSK